MKFIKKAMGEWSRGRANIRKYSLIELGIILLNFLFLFKFDASSYPKLVICSHQTPATVPQAEESFC